MTMRTTVRIDDDLLSDLKDVAKKEKISLTKAFNKVLDAGLRSKDAAPKRKRPFHQETFSMGRERFGCGEANRVAAQLEDEETERKMRLSK